MFDFTALDRKMLKKKMKYRRRARLAKQFRRMKRRALRAARSLSRIVAYVGAILFILVATFFCLIYSVKFEPPVAMAWISASMLGTLQGWLLLEPFEIVVGATKGEWTDSMKDVYMEKMGGERYQAAMYTRIYYRRKVTKLNFEEFFVVVRYNTT